MPRGVNILNKKLKASLVRFIKMSNPTYTVKLLEG